MTRRKDGAPAILWFRDDLRLADNPALVTAVDSGRPVLPIFVLDEESAGFRWRGGASRWWLHHSLASLAADLEGKGAKLTLLRGRAGDVVPRLARAVGAGAAFWNRRYGRAERAVDEAVEKTLGTDGIEVETFNGALGHEPGDIRPKAGGWFKIYSPYWRAAEAAAPLPSPATAPRRIVSATPPAGIETLHLGDLELLPTAPDWSGGLAERFTPGEAAAQKALRDFIRSGIEGYGEQRNLPAEDGSSSLSPHLRFGEISPRQVAAAVRESAPRSAATNAKKFMQELAWRDFAYGLLDHVPDIASRSFNPRFSDFPWRKPKAAIRAWQQGQTGYPIVDAGMRQLWRTGWMHNRVRMIAASFLVKDLMVDWRVGEAWFWDTLCDADPANNAVNWQWVAGTGPDAAPFFRIFNPVLQGEKFDPDGTYVRAFVPEVAGLDARVIHRPWEAPADVLERAGVQLGKTYPRPIVAHEEARDAALAAFRATRQPRRRAPA